MELLYMINKILMKHYPGIGTCQKSNTYFFPLSMEL